MTLLYTEGAKDMIYLRCHFLLSRFGHGFILLLVCSSKTLRRLDEVYYVSRPCP